MKIISWNINSIRLRLPLLSKVTKDLNPDIICLQETKVADIDFPLKQVKALGYDHVEFSGEKSYNGVAIISKYPLLSVTKIDVLDYGHKRHISAQVKYKHHLVDLHNFYVPAGGDVPDIKLNDKFDHKLKFIDWMSDHFSRQENRKVIMVGDMNIAPYENDVWSHKQLLKVVSHTPIEVEKMFNLKASLKWVDCHRKFSDLDQKLYSWWSYRALDPMKSNRGRRLDHIWLTSNLEKYLKSATIHSKYRSAKQPSDHVPIGIELND